MNLKPLAAAILLICSVTSNAQKQTKKLADKKYNWEAGLNMGATGIFGDVTAIPGLNVGAWLSKPITAWFSINLKYETGTAKGLNWQPANN